MFAYSAMGPTANKVPTIYRICFTATHYVLYTVFNPRISLVQNFQYHTHSYQHCSCTVENKITDIKRVRSRDFIFLCEYLRSQWQGMELNPTTENQVWQRRQTVPAVQQSNIIYCNTDHQNVLISLRQISLMIQLANERHQVCLNYNRRQDGTLQYPSRPVNTASLFAESVTYLIRLHEHNLKHRKVTSLKWLSTV
jgi:hypothetical protein